MVWQHPDGAQRSQLEQEAQLEQAEQVQAQGQAQAQEQGQEQEQEREQEQDQEQEIESVLSRPEVAERLSRRAELHTRQLVRLFARARSGDSEAEERLRQTKEGRQLWESYIESVERRAREEAMLEAERLLVYRNLLALRDQSPQEFARYMAQREWREFANEMEARYGNNLAQLSLGTNETQSAQTDVRRTATNDRWQSGGASVGSRLDVDTVFERLRSRPYAKLLTERDWEELDPTNFQDMDPSEAIAEMSERFARLVEKRKAASPTVRAAQEKNNLKNAVQKMPPVPATGLYGEPWWLNMEEESEHAKFIDAFNENPGDPVLRKRYAEYRSKMR